MVPAPVEPSSETAGKRKRESRQPVRPKGPFTELDAFTVEEVAGLLQISVRAVEGLISSRKLNKIKIGASVRVTYSQYLAYLRRKESEDALALAA